MVAAILSIAAPHLTAANQMAEIAVLFHAARKLVVESQVAEALRFQVEVIAMESMSSAIDANSLAAVSQVVDVEVLVHAVRKPMAVRRLDDPSANMLGGSLEGQQASTAILCNLGTSSCLSPSRGTNPETLNTAIAKTSPLTVPRCRAIPLFHNDCMLLTWRNTQMKHVLTDGLRL